MPRQLVKRPLIKAFNYCGFLTPESLVFLLSENVCDFLFMYYIYKLLANNILLVNRLLRLLKQRFLFWLLNFVNIKSVKLFVNSSGSLRRICAPLAGSRNMFQVLLEAMPNQFCLKIIVFVKIFIFGRYGRGIKRAIYPLWWQIANTVFFYQPNWQRNNLFRITRSFLLNCCLIRADLLLKILLIGYSSRK